MNKLVKIVPCIALLALSGPALAQAGSDISALEAVIAGTDMQFAAGLGQYQAAGLPAPSAPRAVPAGIRVRDITEKCTRDGEVVSAYPLIYKSVPREENARIIKVVSFADSKGAERRIEVFFTGGDWMAFGLTYFITNAGPDKTRASAYFMADLSTPDREDGAVEPRIDPFNDQQLEEFIAADFLDAAGDVNAVFGSIAAAAAN